MIAVIEPESRTLQDDAPKFEELFPAIQKQAAIAFSYMPASDREEFVAETVANAYCAFQRLVERGKADVAYATPLAQFAIRQIRSGRRVGNRQNIKDVMSPCAQQAKNITVERLDSVVESRSRWEELVVEDRTGPAEVAITKIDLSNLIQFNYCSRSRWPTLLADRTNRQSSVRIAVSQQRSFNVHYKRS